MTKPNFNEIIKTVCNFLSENNDVRYNSEHLVKILKLKVSPLGLTHSLSTKHTELGLLLVRKTDEKYKAYFAISKTCKNRECYSDWCSSNVCKARRKNPQFKYYSE
jgi:hypothetical protein